MQAHTLNQHKKALDDLVSNPKYKKTVDKMKDRIGTHQRRIDTVQSVKNINEKARSNPQIKAGEIDVASAYAAAGGGRGFRKSLISSGKSCELVQQMIRYEEDRKQALAAQKTDHIARLTAYNSSLGANLTEAKKQELLAKEYRRLGGKAVKENR